MVSVAVSKLCCTELFFVEPGVKVDGRYYREVSLKKQMLPVMRRIAGDTCFSRAAHRRTVLARQFSVFQQGSTPAHCARETCLLYTSDAADE